MPNPCTVCGHPRRADVEAALAAGEPQREVAGRFGVSKQALARHAAHGPGPPAPPTPNRPTAAKGPPTRTTPTALERAKRQREAFDHRLAGKSYPEIADELDCSPAHAFELVEEALQRTHGETNERAEKLRAIEVARCDAIIASFWERATDEARATTRGFIGGVRNGHEVDQYDPSQDKAAATLLKAMERRAKLLGLDLGESATVQIAIVQHPAFNEITKAIFDALRPYPEARAAVMSRMRAAIATRRAEAQLTGG